LNSALVIRAGLQGEPNPAESVDRCRALGAQLSGAQKVELHAASIGTSNHGPTCRLVMGDDRHRAVFVAVVVGATEFLAMTCNHDARDENAAAGCDALFDTISLSAGAQ
jgi:hypothetical protein